MIFEPDTDLPWVKDMRPKWQIIDDLWAGTHAMRAGNYLVRFEQESGESFKQRKDTATLLPAFRQAVLQMTGRVFSEPIRLLDDVPPVIAKQMEDVDGQGNNLQVFARRWFMALLRYGVAHVVVDHPPRPQDVRNTRSDYQAAGLRPYGQIVVPPAIHGWRSEKIGSTEVVTQIRIREVVTEPDGEFGVSYIEQVRVIDTQGWRIYRKVTKGNKSAWELIDQGANQVGERPFGKVPIVPIYADRLGLMMAEPPLMDVADLNVKHFNHQSDQDKAVRFARIRTGAIIGVDEMPEVKVSADSMLRLPVGGDIKFAQGSAESVTVGMDDLDAIVQQMRQSGASLLRKEFSATRTATQAKEEAAQEMSPLEAMALSLQDGINLMLQYFAEWQGLPDGGHCEVRGNFAEETPAEIALPHVQSMVQSGSLSKETAFGISQARGVVPDDITWEDELERIANDGPALSEVRDPELMDG